MILAVAISFALLAIVAGMFLLAKTRKDNLGKCFSFMSWFVVFSGFIIILFAVSAGTCKYVHHHKMMCNKEMNCKFDKKPCMMGDFDGCRGMCCMNCDKICCEHNMGKMGCELGMGKMGCGPGMGKMGCGQGMGKMGCEPGMGRIGYNSDMWKMTPEEKVDKCIKICSERMKLTNEQIPKVREIILKSIKDREQNMKTAGGCNATCEKLCDKTNKDKMEALKKVLTPEQLKELE